MSLDLMPIENLSGFTAAPHHPMAPEGYSVYPAVDAAAQQLQDFRVASGLTQEQVADRLGCNHSKVVRMENGQARPSLADAQAVLRIYNVSDEEIVNGLIEAVRHNRRVRTSSPYTGILEPVQQHALGYEGVAKRTAIYAPQLVPDFLLTADYAKHRDGLFHNYNPTESRLSMQLLRERATYLLGRFASPLEIIIAEGALRRPEKGPSSSGDGEQYAQLRTIIRGLMALCTAEGRQAASGELNPNITIQVAPYSSGTHPFNVTPYAHAIFYMGNRLNPAVYAHIPSGKYSMFRSGLDVSTIDQSNLFTQLQEALPGPEHTYGLLGDILDSLPS